MAWRYGPWKTNTQIYSVGLNPARIWPMVVTQQGPDPATTAETTGVALDVPANTPVTGPTAGLYADPPTVDFVTNFYAYQQLGFVTDISNMMDPTDPAGAYPPHADSTDPDYLAFDWDHFEFEVDHGTYAADQPLTIGFGGGDGSVSGSEDSVTHTYRISLLAAAENYTIDGTTGAGTFVSFAGSTLAGRTARDLITGPNVDSISVGGLPAFTVPQSALGSGLYAGIIGFVVWAAEQETASFPTPSPAVASSHFAAELGVNVSAPYRSPRWRLVYLEPGLPPLRQYPRDDKLGGAPRQGQTNGSTSIQNSARQGWANTYR